jgi:hypothetical protein
MQGVDVSPLYKSAIELWTNLLSRQDELEPDSIARIASQSQIKFAMLCDNESFHKELMAVTAIARYAFLPLSQLDDVHLRVEAMIEGLQKSTCSMEISGTAEQTAKCLYLIE